MTKILVVDQIRAGAGLLDSRSLVDNISRKVGDGLSTLFWLDNWLGECLLERSFSRLYALAENKLITVSEMFSLGWGGGRRGVEMAAEVTRVGGGVGGGVCGLLSTKDNLRRRGVIDTSQLSCATLCGKAEDRDHVFFQCEVYGWLWLLISKWLGYESVFHGSTDSHSSQFRGLGGVTKNSRTAFTIIWISVLFVIWKDRNRRMFKSGSDTLETLAEKIKL
ncbi:hypothetical protein TSUD_84930 [Trifolium subterraneum]|uniref:Reverse transcriptase zinc-binding domain-containing protein n=1 Tax=Trifolium subterraneum TaxID=3900 RepID=A0A2Z6M6C1_TRISU|nr:hypothetical protein TSUD_84930 [Trifolium subterraneum]